MNEKKPKIAEQKIFISHFHLLCKNNEALFTMISFLSSVIFLSMISIVKHLFNSPSTHFARCPSLLMI
jgi:hypothetical protein